ncbi:rho guanyl nucleotide exchange factor [Lichtheimia corymbifera JMRC:FSU:9682]|uniref:Rho guanyl nucleotide exchange factor n=1 Tax=Lichtheimia corymbifera JMRC:FSU:9682 TaxID=1263082 RepID=A0A068S5A1_9FUNG|nr:rho guanyl nucleotide exchange factor [Lichtheimia corymbifera JMRC:FSU:9682]
MTLSHTTSVSPRRSNNFLHADRPSLDELRRSSSKWLNGGSSNSSNLFRLGSSLARRATSMTPAPSRSTPHPRASLQETRTKIRAKPSFDGRSRIRQENGNTGTDIYDSAHVVAQQDRDPSSGMQSTLTVLYCAYLSVVAREFRRRIILVDRVKNGIEYKNVFDGREAIDTLADIIGNTQRRDIALRLGRALGAQRFFHDVNYESRLVDTFTEIYQFYDDNDYFGTSSSDSSVIVSTTGTEDSIEATTPEYDSSMEQQQHQQQQPSTLPNGVFTDLTYCYVPTCVGKKPCYSHTCPKRERLHKRPDSIDARLARSTTHAYLRQQEQQLWSNTAPPYIAATVSSSERKRQETIFELVYTEENFVKDLEYIHDMWIQPLREQDIIPASRRETFINKVFCNIMAIHQVNHRFLSALRVLQEENPIVAQIGDVVLDFVMQLEPFLLYGARQHEAKYMLDQERVNNKKFAVFAEETERDPSSYRLELDGYLSKPTARLGRYTLFLDAILKHTPPDNPDRINIPKATDIIKQFLTRVNEENGKAKNRFDLERIDQKLLFKSDKVDLKLLEQDRVLVKQVKLCKNPNADAPPNYLVLLFDHYLVMTKVKLINRQERYVVKRRPIPLELLEVSLPAVPRRSSSILPSMSHANRADPSAVPNRQTAGKATFPIVFQHIGRRGTNTSLTLYAPALPILKPWVEQIRIQQSIRSKREPVFAMIPAVQEHRFLDDVRINHIVTFNNGQQYVLATDAGVYVGHTGRSSKPHKILAVERVAQVQVLEEAQLLLILADKTLYEYSLDVVNNKPEEQAAGRPIQSHVPHFHVGSSLGRKLVCIPRVTTPLNTNITLFEPSRPNQMERNKRFLGKIVKKSSSSSSSPSDIHLKKFKECYIPSEAWALELSQSQMLITCPRGIIMVDLRSNQTQQMLNPDDRSLSFITEREKDESRLNIRAPMKHIAVFRAVRGDHFVCYDEFGFYIDGRGNRNHRNFKIEFEGAPEAYAFAYPYVVAFEPNFIEIRNVITGALEQIIRGRDIRCLNNGHKTEKPFIYGVMGDPSQPTFQYIFQLQPLFTN